ncbi:single-strand DNA-binding protein [Catalinimonas alkaloidigena]|uniref:Single-stranded DNA-binding protein n=1 Tax=Catalinimonas alkaloidigena TaxID=1075417 RepID=A0A1G9LUH2_9BACT|nr:single-stranded DNA-binding protein [Catalinimonas alkaloidigena]SDL65065.1 single-strand DNA-binding protein [Catalinimonas alkaloidigena]
MNALRNRVMLIGKLGADPEIKQLNSSPGAAPRTLAKFSLATDEVYRNAQGEKVTETQWHSITAWGRLAEIAAQYLTKGREVAVEGKIVYRSYEDAQGNRRFSTEIVINDLLMLGQKPKAETELDPLLVA